MNLDAAAVDDRHLSADLAMDAVTLRVGDLEMMSSYYENALALTPLEETSRRAGEVPRVLGRGQVPFVRLISTPGLPAVDPREAGLFHTAFLFADQASLAGTVLRAAQDPRSRFAGTGDHLVSEAFYFTDPEGNGIEIYRDRSPDQWTRHGDRIRMFTRRLDLDDLLSAADTPWSGIPGGSTMGHVHLQVGDLDRADEFLAGDLALTRTFDAQGGAWYGWNGYHHHLAANIWNSAGAGPRDPGMTGLAEVVIAHPGRAGETVADPWRTRFRFT